MKKSIKHGLVSALAAMTVLVSAGAVTQAAPQGVDATEPCTDCVQENAPDRARPVTDQNEYDRAVSAVNDSLRSGQLKSPTDINQFDFDKATVLEIEKEGAQFQTVTIPLKGSSPLSNFTVVYNYDGSVSNYAESQFYEGQDGKFAIDQWSNGEYQQTKNLDIDYMSDDEVESEFAKVREQSEPMAQAIREERGVGKVATCLATVAGIGGPLGYVVAGACAGSCVSPDPATKTVCAACIGAYAALGAGGMGAAAACFQLW